MANFAYPKKWKSYPEQLAKLRGDGLLIADDEQATSLLQRVGYYRLSGYWYPMRSLSDICSLWPMQGTPTKAKTGRIVLSQFKTGARFSDAVSLYEFDKKLRLIVLDALERLEVMFREDICHRLGAVDPFAYLKPDLFHPKFSVELAQTGLTRHHEWLSRHAKSIGRSKDDCIRHNKDKYGLPLAIWVACETWEFGTMSMLYDGLVETDQDAIASQYGVSNGRIFASWLRSLNYLRNVCAHHNRLWNRNIIDQPRLPSATEFSWIARFEGAGSDQLRARPFLLFCIVKHLLKRAEPGSLWPTMLTAHLDTFPRLDHVGLGVKRMGTPEQWEQMWNTV